MSPRIALLLGIVLLIGAQALSSFALAPMRGHQAASHDVYGSLKPGEFATVRITRSDQHDLWAELA